MAARRLARDGGPQLGSRHAERWIWLHAAGFAEHRRWLDVALGRIKLGPATTPWVASGALLMEGSSIRLGGPGRARQTEVDEAPDRCELALPGGGLPRRAQCRPPPEDFVGWVYADPDGSEHNTINCSVADLALPSRGPARAGDLRVAAGPPTSSGCGSPITASRSSPSRTAEGAERPGPEGPIFVFPRTRPTRAPRDCRGSFAPQWAPALSLPLPLALVPLTIAAPSIPLGRRRRADRHLPRDLPGPARRPVGKLSLPAGPYTITVRGGLSCASASDLFRQFLEDWDGRLPRPWALNVRRPRSRAGANGDTGFSVKRTSVPQWRRRWRQAPGQRREPVRPSSGCCTTTASAAQGRAGNYRITTLAVGRISCAAPPPVRRVLQDFDGRLPRPWFLDPQTGTFLRGSSARWVQGQARQRQAGQAQRGWEHPSDGTRCSATFRVLHTTASAAPAAARARTASRCCADPA